MHHPHGAEQPKSIGDLDKVGVSWEYRNESMFE
jgi:hypothetical protein